MRVFKDKSSKLKFPSNALKTSKGEVTIESKTLKRLDTTDKGQLSSDKKSRFSRSLVKLVMPKKHESRNSELTHGTEKESKNLSGDMFELFNKNFETKLKQKVSSVTQHDIRLYTEDSKEIATSEVQETNIPSVIERHDVEVPFYLHLTGEKDTKRKKIILTKSAKKPKINEFLKTSVRKSKR